MAAVCPKSVGNLCMLMFLRVAVSDCVMCRKIKRKANGRTRDHCFLLMVIFFYFSFSTTVTSFFLLFLQCFDLTLVFWQEGHLACEKFSHWQSQKEDLLGPNLEWSLVKRPVKQNWKMKVSMKEPNISIYFFFSRPSLDGVLFPMFCLLVEGECRILVF